jgi:hypothetical protein
MTDEELKGLAAQCANMAKTEMRNKRSFSAILASYHEGEGLHRMRDLEKQIIRMAGEDWLNKGGAKDLVFDLMRHATSLTPPDAFAFASVANNFEPTALFERLPLEEKQRLATDGRVKEGYFQPHDILAVTVQTPERVCLYKQRLQGALFIGEPDLFFGPQADFSGRMKMFGKEKNADA